MTSTQNTDSLRSQFFLKAVLVIVLLFISIYLKAQEPPPRPISVTWTNQNLSFGAFYQGASGGTVTISSTGVRSSTGDVWLLFMGSTSTSRYEIVANPGTVVSVLGSTSIITDGSGHSLSLDIPASIFVTSAGTVTYVEIGGTLIVGTPAANPPGNYNGSFAITFNQE